MRVVEEGGALTRRAPLILLAGGTLGIFGILVSAAGAHRGGAELAATAGQFALVHGAAMVGLAAIEPAKWVRPWMLTSSALCLWVGTILFSGDLALAGLMQRHPFPPAAPLGGLLLMAGWVLVIVTGVRGLVSSES